MCTFSRDDRASGLIIALAVLALISVMATTFITLMRLDVRITANYVDDQRCEMLAHGMMNYLASILREDQNRMWGRYENRDMAVGVAKTYADWESVNIPGIMGGPWGTTACNDLWFTGPQAVNSGGTGDLYDINTGHMMETQESFLWNDYYNRQHGVIARYERSIRGQLVEVDAFVDRIRNCWANDGSGLVVDKYHHLAGAGVDDDGDGQANPPWDGSWYTGPYGREQNADSWYYYNQPASVLFARNQAMFPGVPFTGERTLPGGLYWRWSLHMGYGHSMYMNLNTAGNVDRVSAVMSNMGDVGLEALPALDDTMSLPAGDHLGRLEWKGFQDEYCYNTFNTTGYKGFPRYYNAVAYQPAQMSLERLFNRVPPPGDVYIPNVDVDRTKAANLVRQRWGGHPITGDGSPADGSKQWRVGWRRDGATWFKIPSPENPMGNDRYFGINEALEHNYATYNPSTSFLASLFTPTEARRIRPFATFWSTDTILRGKIWPTEGPPYTSRQGEWRHIDILKRVNINIIGASNPDAQGYPHLPGEDLPLLRSWYNKRERERDRLYFMLVAAMNFTGTSNAHKKACQFIASLADMVDRDQNETFYAAPDGTGNWALGVEKHPVLNEIVFYSKSNAATPDYELFRMRVELYNPAENIPWIHDVEEAYDVRDYILRIGSHDYRVGDLKRFTDDPNTYHVNDGAVTTIGADGMYGDPNDSTPTKQTWSRYMHLGWLDTVNWPPGLTRAQLEGPDFSGVEFSLWKPVSADVPTSPGKVEIINGTKHLCVDTTGTIRLVRPYGGTTGRTGPGGTETTYLGIYRRWDPMNGKLFGTEGTDEKSNVLWCSGWSIMNYPTLGKPNVNYPGWASTLPAPGAGLSPYKYQRRYERNFKVVDGDLPSIGWLGELMMKNCAEDGPLTQLHASAQDPSVTTSSNQLDTHAKFDLFRPFHPVVQYNPASRDCKPWNLHVLDVFTVWDPSNDGIDNDGDGAIDDADTGRQLGDRAGPEVRVFGRLDLNYAGLSPLIAVFPDNRSMSRLDYALAHIPNYGSDDAGIVRGRQDERHNDGHGPYETIGDLLRRDVLSSKPGAYLGGTAEYGLIECGFTSGDDDGDGIPNERDERDMIFTWVSNYFTTRHHVFEMNMVVDIGPTPYYPGRKLPMPTHKSDTTYARKQVIGVLDRSTTLRIDPSGACDFTAPVNFRMLRFTSDVRAY